MLIYGPVPSRRLGQSLGVNNIPPKACTYSCVYCQIGRTNRMTITRSEFYRPEELYARAVLKTDELRIRGEHVDYVSFVPDGEPTLDKNLGAEIDLMKNLDIKTAVITNASLLWMDDVKSDLMKADWVSVKVDAADEETWNEIDRPHGLLKLRDVLEGVTDFSKTYGGTLVTETMLAEGINDSLSAVEKIALRIKEIKPVKAYLLVPVRPPAEGFVKRPDSRRIADAAQLIRDISGAEVECVTGDEQEEGFFFNEEIINDLLSIASVHPVREDIVDGLLKKRKADKSVVTDLIKQNRLKEIMYEGKKFYLKVVL